MVVHTVSQRSVSVRRFRCRWRSTASSRRRSSTTSIPRPICTTYSPVSIGIASRSVSACPCRKPHPDWSASANRMMLRWDGGSPYSTAQLLCVAIQVQGAAEAEILVLRHQINVLRRKAPRRVLLTSVDRLIFVSLYRLVPTTLDALAIIKPETIVRWHRRGFGAYWRWKYRSRGGRPNTEVEIRQLIRQMSLDNPLWGAPQFHGELLKPEIDVDQTTVTKYMVRHRRPPSQGWRTFLRNHADGIASIDLFVVPTAPFRLLQRFLMLRHGGGNSCPSA